MKHVITTVATIIFAAIGFGAVACGSSPCAEYCDYSCNKAVECEMTGASASTVDTCASQCTEMAEELYTDSLCESALNQVNGLSCEEFLSMMGY